MIVVEACHIVAVDFTFDYVKCGAGNFGGLKLDGYQFGLVSEGGPHCYFFVSENVRKFAGFARTDQLEGCDVKVVVEDSRLAVDVVEALHYFAHCFALVRGDSLGY